MDVEANPARTGAPGNFAITDEPAPVKNEYPAIADLVIEDMHRILRPEVWAEDLSFEALIKDLRDRKELGAQKYGTPLQPFNGRNALVDLYQELLDGLQYARQALFESAPVKRIFLAKQYEQLAFVAVNIRNLIRMQELRGV